MFVFGCTIRQVTPLSVQFPAFSRQVCLSSSACFVSGCFCCHHACYWNALPNGLQLAVTCAPEACATHPSFMFHGDYQSNPGDLCSKSTSQAADVFLELSAQTRVILFMILASFEFPRLWHELSRDDPGLCRSALFGAVAS